MASLRLSILGPFQVMLDEQPVIHFDSNKVRALLTYLAAEPDRPHSREFLADLLWSDSPRRASLNNLRYTTSCLRKALNERDNPRQAAAPLFINADRNSIQFNKNSPAWVDVWEFSELASTGQQEIILSSCLELAVNLYRGEFMQGFSLPGCIAFEEWLIFKREQYKRLMLVCLNCLADYFERKGDYKQAQFFAWKLVEMEPWLEEGYQHLMRALALGGQRTTALAQFDTCRQLLARELGVEPSRETTTIYEAIRNDSLENLQRHGSSTYTTHPAATRRIEPRPESQQHPRDDPSAFYDFAQPVSQLLAGCRQAAAGSGQVIFIAGDPGTGKTTLARELVRRAQFEFPSLVIACGCCTPPSEVSDPYLPFAEILHALTCPEQANQNRGVYQIPPVGITRQVQGVTLHALAEQGPEIIAHLLSPQELLEIAGSLGETETSHMIRQMSGAYHGHIHQDFFHPMIIDQFYRVLVTLAGCSPILLILDDLHWADRSTTALLYHIGRRIASIPVLILALYRPANLISWEDQPSLPLDQVILELTGGFAATKLNLNNADGRSFINTCLDSQPNHYSDEFRETLYKYTSGHPLMTVELLENLRDSGDLYVNGEGYWLSRDSIDWDILPQRVQALISGQLSRLPHKWLRLLQAASVDGVVFTAELAAQMAGIDPNEAVHWLSGPLSQPLRMVKAAGFRRNESRNHSTYRFTYLLYQKHLYQQMDIAERAYLHEQCAAILSEKHSSLPDQLLALINWHRQQAGYPQVVTHI